MKEIIDAVADMDWGSKGASALAGRFNSAAQAIRDHAAKLAAEAEAHGTSFQGVALSIAEARPEGWSGDAEKSYRRQLHDYSESGHRISGTLRESATLLRAAGDQMAQSLENMASTVAGLGASFDHALDVFAEGYEKADEALDDIFDSPLADIQRNIDDYKNNSLLRFAESLF